MNTRTLGDARELMTHRIRVVLRHIDPVRRTSVFSSKREDDSLQRIYVINLDRKPKRWKKIRAELARFRERHGQRLTVLTRRFSAVDARYLQHDPDPAALDITFTLAEQLAVHPNPLLKIDEASRSLEITMTRQEQAIALSHIEIWKLIANGDVPSALILEDDIILGPGFANGLSTTWSALADSKFDLVYLAYRDVGEPQRRAGRYPVRRDKPGIWEASGYILTKDGARTLLEELPVRGPVDLWLNMRFAEMKVYTSPRHLIEQRVDEPSTNSYSVLPVLSQVGAITREKPLLQETRTLPGPVIATGPPESGLSSLAEALSMLGYACLSDVAWRGDETRRLRKGKKNSFTAYVNVGGIDDAAIAEIAHANRGARFITTDYRSELPGVDRTPHLSLSPDTIDKWDVLSEFLGVDYPSFDYPERHELGQRSISFEHANPPSSFRNQKWDQSPWIRKGDERWPGYQVAPAQNSTSRPTSLSWRSSENSDIAALRLRDDTFPSNLALFTPRNVVHKVGQPLNLLFSSDSTPVREFSAGAVASKDRYLYGSFAATLQPSNVSGLITGLFLHRNGPRQEIDIEFLGKDTTKMLINVFYNPGPEGTKLEYGYRGTPTTIDLGFDASLSPHVYEIEWLPNAIIWKVDGCIVYQRFVWGPTPIPDLPLEFNINLWHSRSVEFAGRLDTSALPARTSITTVEVEALDTQHRCVSKR